jgi:hypothetical protein
MISILHSDSVDTIFNSTSVELLEYLNALFNRLDIDTRLSFYLRKVEIITLLFLLL